MIRITTKGVLWLVAIARIDPMMSETAMLRQ
jgi:hypothetical protein